MARYVVCWLETTATAAGMRKSKGVQRAEGTGAKFNSEVAWLAGRLGASNRSRRTAVASMYVQQWEP